MKIGRGVSELCWVENRLLPLTLPVAYYNSLYYSTSRDNTAKIRKGPYWILMYKTAVYTLVNGAITHQKPQI